MDYSDTRVAVYPGASLMAFHVPQLLGHQPMHPHTAGRLITYASLVLALAACVGPAMTRRRRRTGRGGADTVSPTIY
jgi:cyanate permease